MPQNYEVEAEQIDAVVELLGVPVPEGTVLQALTVVMHATEADGVQIARLMLLAPAGTDREPLGQLFSAAHALSETYNAALVAEGDNCGLTDEEYRAELLEHAKSHDLDLAYDEDGWTLSLADGRRIGATDGVVEDLIRHFGCQGHTEWPPTGDQTEESENRKAAREEFNAAIGGLDSDQIFDLRDAMSDCAEVLEQLQNNDDDTTVIVGEWFQNLAEEDPAYAALCFLNMAGRLVPAAPSQNRAERRAGQRAK